MEQNLAINKLNDIALNVLSRAEYSIFLDIMQKIRDRAMEKISISEEEEEINKIRYSHDIELCLKYSIFRNNTKGERVELKKTNKHNFLVKCPLQKDPTVIIDNIVGVLSGEQ
jgi:putative sterol carrier protein